MYAFSTWLIVLGSAIKPCTVGIHVVQSEMKMVGTFAVVRRVAEIQLLPLLLGSMIANLEQRTQEFWRIA